MRNPLYLTVWLNAMPHWVINKEKETVTIKIDEKSYERPLMITCDGGATYHFWKAGSYNAAYLSVTEPYEVYKERLNMSDATDAPRRAIRVWNELNPQFPARIASNGKAWIAPKIEGTTPADAEIANKLFDIFKGSPSIENSQNTFHRIVVDALININFIKTNTGEIVCIDPGCALHLENRMGRLQSRDSLEFWDEPMQIDFFLWLHDNITQRAKTAKALLYWEYMHFSDTRDVETLRRNETLIDEYAKKYDAICAVPATRKVETMWRDKTELSQEKIRTKIYKKEKLEREKIANKEYPAQENERCETPIEVTSVTSICAQKQTSANEKIDLLKKEIIERISRYRKIAYSGRIGITAFFRDRNVTGLKAANADALIKEINVAKNEDEIYAKIQDGINRNKEYQKNPYFLASSRYGECLSDCEKLLEKHCGSEFVKTLKEANGNCYRS